MPFVEIDVDKEIEKRRENDPKFRKVWDETHTEYEMISLRKKENMTQKELAKLTGQKQQVISRIERKERMPSIGSFNKILNALGYELKIVKKEAM